jgi:hypothetical protein
MVQGAAPVRNAGTLPRQIAPAAATPTLKV